MRTKTLLLAGALLVVAVGTAHAAGGGGGAAFPGAGMLQQVEGWLSGPIAFFLGVIIICALAGLIYMAVEYAHLMSSFFRAFLAIAFVVFCVAIMTAVAGAGATITPPGVASRIEGR
jgi:type IV secretory pathway VirB2 component (pilin)